VLLLVLGSSACATHPPPTLSPAGTVAYQNIQIQRALDLIRDTAHDANAAVPPLLSTPTTVRITQWHRSALIVLHQRGAGWRANLRASVGELAQHLPAAERPRILPFIVLAQTLLQEGQP
jgi:hypothetical protein